MDKKSLKDKPNAPKKNLVQTKNQSSRIKIIVTVAVLLIAALTYYIIDSGSYVATVDGNRISKAEYQYFLSNQVSSTEAKNGLTTQDAKDKFWTTPADGQDPWQEAKRQALDVSKEFMIQRLKAQEMGLKVDATIKNETASYMNSLRTNQGLTEKQFSDTIRTYFKISRTDFQKIYENLSLIEKFKNSYLSKNYKPAALTDNDIKADYDKDPKKYDKADIRYISLSKLDASGKELAKDQLDAKKKLADEALTKLKQGEDVNKVVEQYTEEKATAGSSAPLGTATGLTYFTGSDLIDWVFNNKVNDSGIIESETAIFVVKITKRTTFEDVKADAKTTLENEAREKFYSDALHGWSLEPQFNIITNERIYNSFTYKNFK